MPAQWRVVIAIRLTVRNAVGSRDGGRSAGLVQHRIDPFGNGAEAGVAAEFEGHQVAGGEGCFHGLQQPVAGVDKRAVVVAAAEPVEHHRRRQECRRRVRLAAAGDVGRGAVARLEDGALEADIARRCHAHAACTAQSSASS